MMQSWKSRLSSNVGMHVVFATLGLAGVVVVLLSTYRYGAGTFADVENYVSAARNLLAGKGFRYYFGALYTHWPPLFPTLLAAIGLTGVDPLTAARLLNALAFGLIVFFSGRLFLRCTTSKALALAGTLAILTSGPLVSWGTMAASEPVFTLLVLLFALCVPRYLQRPSLSRLTLVSVLAALACLQRYAGVGLIPAGVLLVGLGVRRVSLLQRLKHVAIFGTLSTTPIALWCFRNWLLARETVGVHHPHLMSVRDLFCVSRGTMRVMASWLAPWASPDSARALSLAAALAAACAAIVLSRRVRQPTNQNDLGDDGTSLGSLHIWSAAVTGLVYSGFLVTSGAGLAWCPEQRHMSPIYPLVIAVLVAGVDGARRLLSATWGHRRSLSFVVILLSALWLLYPAKQLARDTVYRMRVGAGGFSTKEWAESPLMQWLRDHPLSGPVYSNGSDAVYILTGITTWLTPQIREPHGPLAFADRCASEPSYLVWFNSLTRAWLYDQRELLSCCRTEVVATFPDGAVYRCLGRGGPEVSAVYRFWSWKSKRHRFTIRKAERDRLLLENDGTWRYEGPVFYAIAPDDEKPANARPVFRLWSASLQAQFYTIDETERDWLVAHPSGTWACEGVAFYAWPQPSEENTVPVYRFWSARLGCHFFTISEAEKDTLIAQYPETWTYEGIGWYAQKP